MGTRKTHDEVYPQLGERNYGPVYQDAEYDRVVKGNLAEERILEGILSMLVDLHKDIHECSCHADALELRLLDYEAPDKDDGATITPTNVIENIKRTVIDVQVLVVAIKQSLRNLDRL